MTLIITIRANDGIIMFADSAITNASLHTYNTGNKLLKIDYLNAGIASCGLNRFKSGMEMNVWLKNFIIKNKTIAKSIQIFVDLLKQELNNNFNEFNCNSGFHIAGYETINNKKVAVFHHLTNKKEDDYWDTALREDFYDSGFSNPQDFVPNYIIHNGDFYLFNFLNQCLKDKIPINIEAMPAMTKTLTELCHKKGIEVNNPLSDNSPEGTINLIRLVLGFTNFLYEIFARVNTDKGLFRVGGDISHIVITEDGIEDFCDKKH